MNDDSDRTWLRPIFHTKHRSNRPIVTIIGAGVSGLTAAHELVERGFIVQVIESREDPRVPGRCLVGGMAANQIAMIRPRVELLHADLIEETRGRGDRGKQHHARQHRATVRWLLSLAQHNRGPFVRSLPPARLGYRLRAEGPLKQRVDTKRNDRRAKRSVQRNDEPRASESDYPPPALEIRDDDLDAGARGSESSRSGDDRPHAIERCATAGDPWGPHPQAERLVPEPHLPHEVPAQRKLQCIQEHLKQTLRSRAQRWIEDLIRPLDPELVPRDPLRVDASSSSAGPRTRATERFHRIREFIRARIQTRNGEDGPDSPHPDRFYRDLVELLADSFGERAELFTHASHSSETSGRYLEVCSRFLQREFLVVDICPSFVLSQDRENAEILGECIADELARVIPRSHFRMQRASAVRAFPNIDPHQQFWVELRTGEHPLPGEHGFRFFPSFYEHVDDTMKRTPILDDAGRETGATAFDNLRPTTRQTLAHRRESLHPNSAHWKNPRHATFDYVRRGSPDPDVDAVHIEVDRCLPRSLLAQTDKILSMTKAIGAPLRDLIVAELLFFKFMSSSRVRREREYECSSWKQFLEGYDFSPALCNQMEAASQALLAFSIDDADAHTYGNTAMQLFLDSYGDGKSVDRTLNGPTSEAWFDPWRQYLERRGVRFFCGSLEELTPRRAADDSIHVEARFAPCLPEAHIRARRAASHDETEASTDAGRPADASAEIADERMAAWRSNAGVPFLGQRDDGAGWHSDFYILALPVRETNRLLTNLRTRLPDEEFGPGAHGPDDNRDFQRFLRWCDDARIGMDDADISISTEPVQTVNRAAQRNTAHPNATAGRWHFVTDEAPIHRSALRDMTGIQFFFEGKTKLGNGHMYFPDSAWGLSSISQSEFWTRRPSVAYGYLGVLSVDICSCHNASESSITNTYDEQHLGSRSGEWIRDESARSVRQLVQHPQHVALQTWHQIYHRIPRRDRRPSGEPNHVPDPLRKLRVQDDLCDSRARQALHFAPPSVYHLDTNIWSECCSIIAPLEKQSRVVWNNETPFLATTAGTWSSRAGLVRDAEHATPDRIRYSLNFGRWVLAGTHMATYTRMTTMEAANESGRHAARSILARLRDHAAEDDAPLMYNGQGGGHGYPLPDVFDTRAREPRDLEPLWRLDEALFRKHGPKSHFMDILKLVERIGLQLQLADLEFELADAAPTSATAPHFPQADECRPHARALAKLRSTVDKALTQSLESLGFPREMSDELESSMTLLRKFLALGDCGTRPSTGEAH